MREERAGIMALIRAYYAHMLNIYHTPLEKALEQLIVDYFHSLGEEISIENPNQPRHQKSYQEWKARHEGDSKKSGMDYFFEMVCPYLDTCIAQPYLDGMYGLGVAGETKKFLDAGKSVWVIEQNWLLINTATSPQMIKKYLEEFTENPESGLFSLRPINLRERSLITTMDPKIVIPHEQTRLRTWEVYNKVKRLFAKSHQAPKEVYSGFYSGEK